MAGLKEEKCRTEFRQRVYSWLSTDQEEFWRLADSLEKCIQETAKKMLLVLMLRKKDNFKSLLNRQAPSVPEVEHVERPTYAINEEPLTESEVLVCIQKTRNGKSSGDDLKYLPPSGIRRLLNALRADGVPEKFVRLLDDMSQRTTAAVQTPAGCTTLFEVVTEVRQGAVAGSFSFNFAIDDIMRRTVSCRYHSSSISIPLTDLEYADDVVIFAENSTKLQHVVNLLPKLTAAYGLRLRPGGITVDGQLIELKFCYLRCALKKNGSYENDIQRRCAKAISAFTKMLVDNSHHQRNQAASLTIRSSPYNDARIGDMGSTIYDDGEA
ncbi:hypothetical protein RB195_022262 [Necator americanus]|uniref:Reverse transcriptase domain-containing protein n=1 Tax=Necator americanus TaxID=51031 RepID=A0ABR1EH88_NECAM